MDKEFDYKQAWEDLKLAAQCVYAANETAGHAMVASMNIVEEKQKKEVR